MKNFIKLRKKVGKIVCKYKMIQEDDKIVVGMSGGKDSYALFDSLCELKKRAPISFDILPVVVDGGFGTDYKEMFSYVKDKGYICDLIKIEVNKNLKEEKSPCMICSRLRRGLLYKYILKKKATSLALGHHIDDALQTFLLNMFYAGKIFPMRPIYKSKEDNIKVIRPLFDIPENLIIDCMKNKEWPIVKQICPLKPSKSKREKLAKIIKELSEDEPWFYPSVLSSLSEI